VFDDLYFVDLVAVSLVLCWLKLIVLFMGFSLGFVLIFSVQAKRLAGKSISDMTYLVLYETLSHNSVNQLISDSI